MSDFQYPYDGDGKGLMVEGTRVAGVRKVNTIDHSQTVYIGNYLEVQFSGDLPPTATVTRTPLGPTPTLANTTTLTPMLSTATPPVSVPAGQTWSFYPLSGTTLLRRQRALRRAE
jgi:hypothetical protein